MTKLLPVFFAAVLGLLSTSPALADDDASALLTKGIKSLEHTSSEMVVRIERHKKEVVTSFRFHTRTSNREEGVSKSWMLRLEPELQAGMQILAITRKEGNPTVKQYVSATGDIIGLPNPGGGTNLFGTDFQVRDLKSLDVETGAHKEIGKDTITVGGTGFPVTVIETVPAKGVYGKVVRFLDDTTSLPLRVDYFDKAGNPVKRLTVLELAKDRPLAVHTRMEVLGKVPTQFTDMFVESYAFDLSEEALPERTFTDEYLKEVGLKYQ